MFDVEPSEAALATPVVPPQCPPPAADAVAQLNTAEVRVHADDGAEGAVQAGEGEEGGEGGQKVTPWEVEVRGPCSWWLLFCFGVVGWVFPSGWRFLGGWRFAPLAC